MILLDMSQLEQATVHGTCEGEPDIELYRHSIINSLRFFRTKHKEKYGEIVICLDGDGYNYWRKQEFEHYKASRKKSRAKSDINWTDVYAMFDLVRLELMQNFPYKIVRVSCAEADDVIAVLSKEYQKYEKCLILSSDHDFFQLQQFKNIDQYCLRKQKIVKEDNPREFLHEHIMRGDVGDGIPNFLSPIETFVTEGTRQKSIMTKKMNDWVKQPAYSFCDTDMLKRYEENKKLIDFACIPEDLTKEILDVYDDYKTSPRNKIMSYLIKNKLKLLLESLSEF